MRNFFRKFHLWVSVPFGIVITITCFTGALLMFEDEVTALCRDDVTSVAPAGELLSLDKLAERVDSVLPADVDVTGFVIPDSRDEAYKVNLSSPPRAAVYVNQYTGEITGKDERLPFFRTVFRLHRWLMDSDPGDGKVFWGKMIVGTSTLAFVVILITGLVIWWPRNRKMLKNRLHIVVKKGKNRFWHDLHVAGGFYAMLLLLVMALTGLTWSFEWYRNGVYDMLGANSGKKTAVVSGGKENATVEPVQQECPGNCRACTLPVCVYSSESASNEAATVVIGQGSAAQWNADAVSGATTVADTKYVDSEIVHSINNIDGISAATDVDAVTAATDVDAVTAATDVDDSSATQVANLSRSTDYTAWQVAFEDVKGRVSQYKSITVSAGAISVLHGGCGNVRAADKYSFDENGAITSVQLYKDSTAQNKVSGWIYSLHIGAWGGWLGRILAFLAALLGATLPITGYYFWIRRLYGKRKSRK
ncbi:MAG: PepSY domain-containing protein [Bacteroidaceae bacterium]|nr:PepSY domain-containing protein [Bacteroidaceae bacterium]